MCEITHMMRIMEHMPDDPIKAIEASAVQAGIGIDELCKEANIDRSTFTRWKNKSLTPRYCNVIKINNALKRLLYKAAINSPSPNSPPPPS